MKQGGFTLIEVLAALAIFSIAIIGLSSANTQSIKTTDRVVDKTYAGFVADNQLVLARLRVPQIRSESGEEEMGGRTYDWRLDTVETEQAGLFELRISVFDDEEDLLITRRAWVSPQ